jgi:hypothetical protein
MSINKLHGRQKVEMFAGEVGARSGMTWATGAN